eukprot:TRINITY_DN1522_c0_g1_i1.p2 TRINITY_DN1522_c0_g1~~TRINITY_DN1522_c0_g1_i1.p2  ORF type:complete len:138 (+),score=2.30 TRINITY_DN1522_c0_g1_i1:396-809(+)
MVLNVWMCYDFKNVIQEQMFQKCFYVFTFEVYINRVRDFVWWDLGCIQQVLASAKLPMVLTMYSQSYFFQDRYNQREPFILIFVWISYAYGPRVANRMQAQYQQPKEYFQELFTAIGGKYVQVSNTILKFDEFCLQV